MVLSAAALTGAIVCAGALHESASSSAASNTSSSSASAAGAGTSSPLRSGWGGGQGYGWGSQGSGGYGGYGGYGSDGTGGFGGDGSTGGFGNGFGSGGFGGSFGDGGGNSAATGSTASSAQQTGIVIINTELSLQGAEAAGTGMVMTSNGEILTNNHVINGATKVSVTVASTGKTYQASVVGTDPTQDVAVLQLKGASGLAKASLASSSEVGKLSTGDSVTGVGNGGGTGTLNAVSGSVTALDQTITASDDNGSNPETLNGLIGINAAIIPGDSGGPLYDSAGHIVGMDTAADSSGSEDGSASAFAIPITNALKIAKQIESGDASSTVHIGLPAFLGVALADDSDGATVSSVVSGDPADQAGITEGSVITAVGSTKVDSASALSAALQKDHPGQKVSLTWTDESGASHTANVTLASGPAD
jgi:S1-C subfamily serine protease